MKKLNCILLIDDNVDDNFFHILEIKKANAVEQIKTVTTGMKALEYFEKGKEDPSQYPFPDLVFLDINMPGLNGFEFLEQARNKKYIFNGKPLVIVMLTNSFNSDDFKIAKEKFSAEITDFKNKPLTTEMLKEITESFF